MSVSRPPAPTDAATVVLIRDLVGSKPDEGTTGEGVEVFMLRRRGRGFLGGMHLFPGGKVDPEDRSQALRDWVQAEDLHAASTRLAENLALDAAVALPSPTRLTLRDGRWVGEDAPR